MKSKFKYLEVTVSTGGVLIQPRSAAELEEVSCFDIEDKIYLEDAAVTLSSANDRLILTGNRMTPVNALKEYDTEHGTNRLYIPESDLKYIDTNICRISGPHSGRFLSRPYYQFIDYSKIKTVIWKLTDKNAYECITTNFTLNDFQKRIRDDK